MRHRHPEPRSSSSEIPATSLAQALIAVASTVLASEPEPEGALDSERRGVHPRALIVLPFLLGAVAIVSFASPSAGAGWNLLAGGGASATDCDLADGDWSDEVFASLVARASSGGPNGGNGRVAVLDVLPDPLCAASDPGDDLGLCTVLECHGATEVTPLCVTRSGDEPGCLRADAASTAELIESHDGVWFRGGDQSRYRDEWEGTTTVDAVMTVWTAGGIVGGTSAGAMIQSEVASTGDAPSWEATADPWSENVEIGPGPFSGDRTILEGVLVDTHVTRRARLSRLATFIAREEVSATRDLLGIGVDQETALLVGPDRTATVLGEGSVGFVHLRPDSVLDLVPGEPPSARDLAFVALTAGGTVDLARRTFLPAPNAISVRTKAAISTDATRRRLVPRVLEGTSASDALAGATAVEDGGDPAALYEGHLVSVPGDQDLPATVVSTLLEDDVDFRENRAGGPLWAIASTPDTNVAVLLDGFDGVSCNALEVLGPELWRAMADRGCPAEQSVLVVDCCSAAWATFSPADPDGDGLERQSVGLGGCTVSLVASGRGEAEYVPRCSRGRLFSDGFETGDVQAWDAFGQKP